MQKLVIIPIVVMQKDKPRLQFAAALVLFEHNMELGVDLSSAANDDAS